jgi:hypothetical protein
MKRVTRDELKKLFKKVKHLRLPPNLEAIEFENQHYLGWQDESDDVYYVVTEVNGELTGVRGEVNKMPIRKSMMHQCSICHQGREFEEVMLFTVQTKRPPKGIEYQVKGVYICVDSEQCNKDMKNGEQIEKFIRSVTQ